MGIAVSESAKAWLCFVPEEDKVTVGKSHQTVAASQAAKQLVWFHPTKGSSETPFRFLLAHLSPLCVRLGAVQSRSPY